MIRKKDYISSILLVVIIGVFVIGITYLLFINVKESSSVNKLSYVSIIYDNNKKIILTNESILSDEEALDRATGYEILKFKIKPVLSTIDLAKYKLILNHIITTDDINLSAVKVVVYKNGSPVVITGNSEITNLTEILSMTSFDKKIKSSFITSGRLANGEEDDYVIKAWISEDYERKYACSNGMYLTKDACEANGFVWEETPITIAFDVRMVASE